MPTTGTVFGYDPGGNDKHGFASAKLRDGKVHDLTTKTCCNAEEVVESILTAEDPIGIGIDTLTCWSTGRNGDRPADRWLRREFPRAEKSVVSPNSLFGAMSVNGMAVLIAVRKEFPDICVTETHPKVLYHYLSSGKEYDYEDPVKRLAMNESLSKWSDIDISLGKKEQEHEWDAAISILPVVEGLRGAWKCDLHALPPRAGERLVKPCGETRYLWPDRSSGCPPGDRTEAGNPVADR